MESIYSDTFSLFTPNQDIENMEYYDASEYNLGTSLTGGKRRREPKFHE